MRPPYDQLLREIDVLGYVGVGRKYGVSDNAIRKWRRTYETEAAAAPPAPADETSQVVPPPASDALSDVAGDPSGAPLVAATVESADCASAALTARSSEAMSERVGAAPLAPAAWRARDAVELALARRGPTREALSAGARAMAASV